MLKRTIAALILLASPALSEMPDNLARAEISPGWREGSSHVAGLTIRLAPGWKTYWRAPGDAGIPPSFNWSGSGNVAGVRVQFPVPDVFSQSGMRSLGYADQVTFPLYIRARDADAPIRLRGEIAIGVCEEICIPVTLRLKAELPARGARDAALAALMNDRPKSGGPLTCEITPIADGLRLSASVSMPRLGADEVAVIETGDPTVWVSAPVLSRKGGRLRAEVELVAASAKPFALARSDVRMTVMAGGRAVEMLGCR